MDKKKLIELMKLKEKIREEEEEDKRPRLTEEQILFAEELYKAHFTIKETAKMLSFGYGCIASHWQRFRYAKIEKYDRFELIILRGEHANDQIDRVNR